MEKSFWLKKWENNEIGFHYLNVNELLLSYFDKFTLPKNPKTLVPLCGKSVDLLFFAKLGHFVTGVELSEKATNSFFQENGLEFVKTSVGSFNKYQSNNLKLEILQGDFFELDQKTIDPFDFIYDRASLIALPEDMRKIYAKKILNVSKKGTQILLITTEYDHPTLLGPPFSVSEKEIRYLYQENFEIVILERLEKQLENPKFIEAGVKNPARVVYKLIRY